ncbi:putative short-chain dehydrogenase/reductase family 42E member 2 [Xiphophorus couchianus]|uniref:putative short-chain dehydrogenase/reductase family 42E member 2 n=1 Tax=Xiphophorus couchianus TaxID=32473 RepID=UPI0010160045|nr:putative short-chain dehydrogenase/reductase family 42E member 2 [Xiphophorus couchianus]
MGGLKGGVFGGPTDTAELEFLHKTADRHRYGCEARRNAIRMSIDLYSPSMGDSGASMCQMKQLPCHGAPLLRLQACGHHTLNHSNLPHKPCLSDPSLVTSSGAAPALRHRVSGATAGTCNSLNCAASRLTQEVGTAAWDSCKGKVLVTGGGGYFGFRLGKELASEGMTVILLDVNKPLWDIPDGAIFLQSDIRDYSSLHKVCEGVDCIFHTASYGMSGPEQLRKEQVESVNVGGTNNVINVCKERGIPRLVYTSTINVVFAGKPIVDGDEASVPYVPGDLHIDHYSRTKAVAERMVLSANGSSVKGGGKLETCVLRPCGIYGPGERRHLHRVMMNVERRLFSFRFGDPAARMNWVHVDNLVLAHKLAAEALTKKKGCIASGQAYFINDGLSVNLFEWLTPLFEKLGYSRPSITLPVSLVYSAAILVEYLHVILSPVIQVPLLFTRSEVRNITVSHTFKIDKARQELGYCPQPYSLADSVEHYLKIRQSRDTPISLSLPSVRQLAERGILLLLMGLGLVLLIIYGILS